MNEQIYYEQFSGDTPLWNIEYEIWNAIKRDGALNNMPIKGGNAPNERTIKCDIFQIEVTRHYFNNTVSIWGKWFAANRSTGKPEIRDALNYGSTPANASLSDLLFCLPSGEIPRDFL